MNRTELWSQSQSAAEAAESDSTMIAPNRSTGAEHSRPHEIRSITEILSDPTAMRDPEAVIEGIAVAGRVTLLSGSHKTGKTTLVTAMASHVSNGSPFIGRSCAEGDVVWIRAEEALQLPVRRFQSFGSNPDKVYVSERMSDPYEYYRSVLEDFGPKLVVIDTLFSFVARAEGKAPPVHDSVAWTKIMCGIVDPVQESDSAVLILHHARKSDSKYLGPTAIGGHVDMILSMEEGKRKNHREILSEGRWELEDLEVRFDKESRSFSPVNPGGDTEAAVLAYVQADPACSQNAVRKKVSGRNSDIDAAIQRLLEAGKLIDRNEGGRGMKLEPAGSALGI